MDKLTKRSAKLGFVFVLTTVVACLAFVIGLDWMQSWSDEDRGCYVVAMNGKEIGVAKSQEEIENALLAARLKVNEEEGKIVYADPDVQVTEEHRIFARTVDQEELEENFYTAMVDSLQNVVRAYSVDIDGHNIILDSKESVVALLNSAKDKYDVANEFDVDLVEDGDGYYSAITFDMTHADTSVNAAATTVFASVYSTNTTNETPAEEEGFENGLKNLSFEENVEIVETYVNEKDVVPLKDAIEEVTKIKEESQLYEVQDGDCLFSIASKFGLSVAELLAINPDYNENSTIREGDKIIVTVPEPELTVMVTESRTYEEKYDAPVTYVKNDNKYTNERTVISEGTPGYRRVVADITYRNGVEVSREIIHETPLKEATPKVVEVGTIVPPTYVKPMSAGSLSSGFGSRWGAFHKGVDWYVGSGTTVFASCGGTVAQAGWNGGYGYSVLISHPDGKQTRYAHLSSIACSVGEHVDQYDVIGYSGSTGDSTGPHLHFEIIVNGTQVDPFNYI